MINILHIVFGDSACGNLINAFNKSDEYKNEKIICINEDFSIGPIFKIESNEGIQGRKEWLIDLLKKTQLFLDEDYVEWIETSLTKNLYISTKIPTASKVLVWHGENVSDEIGLRYVIFLLQNKNIQFEEVNVTKYSRHIENKANDLQRKEILRKSLAEMTPEVILKALQMKKNISHQTIKSLINDWEKLSQTKYVLRILLNGKILGVPEDYYDTTILEKASIEYRNAYRVVGEVMGESNQHIGDTYLIFRVYQLIQQKKLIYQGKLGHLSKFEIKLPR